MFYYDLAEYIVHNFQSAMFVSMMTSLYAFIPLFVDLFNDFWIHHAFCQIRTYIWVGLMT